MCGGPQSCFLRKEYMLVGENTLDVLDLVFEAVNNSVGLECDWKGG
jgi:hypothetical protein